VPDVMAKALCVTPKLLRAVLTNWPICSVVNLMARRGSNILPFGNIMANTAAIQHKSSRSVTTIGFE